MHIKPLPINITTAGSIIKALSGCCPGDNDAQMMLFRDRLASLFECFALTREYHFDTTLMFWVVDVMITLLERRRVAC